jgi:hypothetical protein
MCNRSSASGTKDEHVSAMGLESADEVVRPQIADWHQAECRVSVCDEGGWDVELEIDGRIAITHCSDWHRVERLRSLTEALNQPRCSESPTHH